MQHGVNTEVVWYHDMLNLNLTLEIVINLVKLDLRWKLMHMGAKVLFQTLWVIKEGLVQWWELSHWVTRSQVWSRYLKGKAFAGQWADITESPGAVVHLWGERLLSVYSFQTSLMWERPTLGLPFFIVRWLFFVNAHAVGNGCIFTSLFLSVGSDSLECTVVMCNTKSQSLTSHWKLHSSLLRHPKNSHLFIATSIEFSFPLCHHS